jgi:hypothetical protein
LSTEGETLLELLRIADTVTPLDSKTYRTYEFAVPDGIEELNVILDYDPAALEPHSALNVTLFDPHGFRGAAHRYEPHQVVRIGKTSAMPGFSAGEIPAGNWRVDLNIFWVVDSVKESSPYSIKAFGIKRDEIRAGKNPAYKSGRWYCGDFHLHTKHSDGNWTAKELVESARLRGLDFIALTDHNTVTGLPEFCSLGDDSIVLIPGMELTTFFGHALTLGTKQWFDWRTEMNGRTINAVAREIAEAGGLFVVVHADTPSDPTCTGCNWTYEDFDFNLAKIVQVWGGFSWNSREEHNEACLELWKNWLNKGYHLPAIGGTDAHGADGWRNNSGWTYVWAEKLTQEAIFNAILAGHAYVSSGPSLIIEAVAADGTATMMGGSVASEGSSSQLIINWQSSPKAELRLIRNGEKIQRSAVFGDGELKTKVDGGAAWCIAELWDAESGDLLAFTNPIYFN